MAVEKPDYLLDSEEREALLCACIEGAMTGGEHHESWCPSVTGDYDGLPILDITRVQDSVIITLDAPPGSAHDESMNKPTTKEDTP